LREGLEGHPDLVEVRHLGLLLAVELRRPCAELVTIALEHGLLINVTAGSVIRLLPPLILSEDEAGEIADILIRCIHQFTG
jgi:acetylornithine aminotransferase